VQTAFLTDFERGTRTETLEAVARARDELRRLRALELDVRWGRTPMQPDKVERLRQYLAGRSEISAGDELVLRHLASKARERQRWSLGLPLLAIGGFALYRMSRKSRASSAAA
jgi:zinc/manganese transport system permease protein